MVLKAIEVFSEIEESDVEFLRELEEAAERFKYIPEDRLTKISSLPEQDINYRMDRLDRFELIEKGADKYSGYKLFPDCYDLLALWDLSREDVLEAFGKSLGIGKEADIYDALSPEEERVAVKFNRLGLSFTSLKEKRPYKPEHGWIDASSESARREFEVLKKLHPDVEVPRPIAFNRHVLVMGLIEGEELGDVKEIDYPEPVLDEIMRNVRKSYKLGVIHGDLSEHNVIVMENGEIMIIDWPQWVPTKHPEANELIERDVKNVLKFFKRKFDIEKDLDDVLIDITE